MISRRQVRSARNAATATARRSIVRVLTRLTGISATRSVAVASLRAVFNSIAPAWEQIRSEPVYTEATQAALAELPHRADLWSVPARALDVACGTGLATQVITASFPAAKVVGVDIAEDMVGLAQSLVPEATFIVADSFDLPFADESWDLIVSVDGIFGARELARVCAPAGNIVIVYTKGASIPVSRDVNEIAAQLTAAGMHCTTDTTTAWCVWASKPPTTR